MRQFDRRETALKNITMGAVIIPCALIFRCTTSRLDGLVADCEHFIVAWKQLSSRRVSLLETPAIVPVFYYIVVSRRLYVTAANRENKCGYTYLGRKIAKVEQLSGL